jgi:hypothetical protein
MWTVAHSSHDLRGHRGRVSLDISPRGRRADRHHFRRRPRRVGRCAARVTVEASSPALIEKSRTAVTDGQGAYSIIDLRPGTYAVTFSLAGFSTVRREGVVLTASFTANVNADMKVGALEETITSRRRRRSSTCRTSPRYSTTLA